MLYYAVNALIGAVLAVAISFLGKTNFYLLTAAVPNLYIICPCQC